MPDLQRISPLLALAPIVVGFLLLLFFLKYLASPGFKGRLGERRASRDLARQLDPALYRHFHDLYLPRPDGQGTTQIDHVVVSLFGIFVIETKNFSGWILGSEKQAQWTQQIYRKKSRFQNPLHQNKLHVSALASFLGLAPDLLLPVVVLVGGCTLKTPMPDNVLTRGLVPWIKGHTAKKLDESARLCAIEALGGLERTTDRKSAARAHVAALRARE